MPLPNRIIGSLAESVGAVAYLLSNRDDGTDHLKMETEIRYSEVRAEPDGRILIGRILVYRDVATLPFGREMFLPGAFSPCRIFGRDLKSAAPADSPHRSNFRGWVVPWKMVEDTLSMRADLPESSAGTEALNLVRGKILRGLSVEFKVRQERHGGRGQGDQQGHAHRNWSRGPASLWAVAT